MCRYDPILSHIVVIAPDVTQSLGREEDLGLVLGLLQSGLCRYGPPVQGHVQRNPRRRDSKPSGGPLPRSSCLPVSLRFQFFIQRWGGPPVYSQRKGEPALRARHAPFPITPEMVRST